MNAYQIYKFHQCRCRLRNHLIAMLMVNGCSTHYVSVHNILGGNTSNNIKTGGEEKQL